MLPHTQSHKVWGFIVMTHPVKGNVRKGHYDTHTIQHFSPRLIITSITKWLEHLAEQLQKVITEQYTGKKALVNQMARYLGKFPSRANSHANQERIYSYS